MPAQTSDRSCQLSASFNCIKESNSQPQWISLKTPGFLAPGTRSRRYRYYDPKDANMTPRPMVHTSGTTNDSDKWIITPLAKDSKTMWLYDVTTDLYTTLLEYPASYDWAHHSFTTNDHKVRAVRIRADFVNQNDKYPGSECVIDISQRRIISHSRNIEKVPCGVLGNHPKFIFDSDENVHSLQYNTSTEEIEIALVPGLRLKDHSLRSYDKQKLDIFSELLWVNELRTLYFGDFGKEAVRYCHIGERVHMPSKKCGGTKSTKLKRGKNGKIKKKKTIQRISGNALKREGQKWIKFPKKIFVDGHEDSRCAQCLVLETVMIVAVENKEDKLENNGIWCLDLVKKQWRKATVKLPGSLDRVHLMTSKDSVRHYLHFVSYKSPGTHMKVELSEIVPPEMAKLYIHKKMPLVAGYSRTESYEDTRIPEDVNGLILKYYPVI